MHSRADGTAEKSSHTWNPRKLEVVRWFAVGRKTTKLREHGGDGKAKGLDR